MFDRRDFLRASGLGLLGASASGWLHGLGRAFAQELVQQGKTRHCILLWMTGGPSQLDTFDLKPGHENGGPFKEIETAAPGVRFSEHLPQLAKLADKLAIVRSLSTKEGDHGRGTHVMRTGHPPQGPVRHPSIGASLAMELGRDDAALPNYVSISPFRAFSQDAFGPGFLGPRHAPLTVAAADRPAAAAPANAQGFAELKVDDLQAPAGVTDSQLNTRLDLWHVLQGGFLKTHRGPTPIAQNTLVERAVKLMRSDAVQAFDLAQEQDEVRERYGKGRFGQGCLLARRLVERGVPFIEVSLGSTANNAIGWDTHQDNFNGVKSLSGELDAGWATLLRELDERGLLASTTILWLGEFGRTPRINPQTGRDHFPAAWSCVFAGGGIRGGQVYGRTSADGMSVEEGKVDVAEILATFSSACGVAPDTSHVSDIGRPIKIAEGEPIRAILS